MKKVFLLLVFCSCCLWGFSQQEVAIESELQAQMDRCKSEEMIDVNIIMKSQYDQMEMRLKSNVFKTKENKRAFVINELKRFSKETQSGIINELQSMEQGMQVKEINAHWIFNGINCKATVEAIEALASNPDILIIGYNRMQNLLPEGEKPTKDNPTKEMVYAITKLNVNDVWDLGFTGEGVIIAVIDTGVNYNHVDVADHMWEDPVFPYHGFDFINNDNNPMDDMGHGSHCAGTVAGDGTAGTQTGMAPDATIMAIKVLNSDGGGNVNAICSGVEFAVEHGAHVFSMSLGFYGGGSQSERITFRNTMINALEAGVVGSVAAGNEGSDYAVPVPNNVRVPGNCPPPWLHPDQTITGGLTCVICVGSTDQNDQISYFSSKGPVTWQSTSGFNDYAYNPGIGLIRPDICAPGSGIKSLNYQNNTGYVMMDGTSMATPCAAGVMGLMLSKNIDLSPAQIDEILETTAVPLSTTKSNTFGSGRIDALAAVEEVIVGPVIFYAYEVNDVEGNHDGKLNPGETVNLTVSMQNIFDTPINNVGVNITSDNPYVTISSATAIYGNFSPNEIKTIENAFIFTLSEDAPIKQNIVLNVEASSSTDNCVTRCKIMTYGYDLSSGKIVVDDGEGNNNGVLEPGETADLQFFINNIGNDFASSLIGSLSSISNDITINTNDLSFGSLMGDQSGFAAYNVTVSENIAPEDINFPFTLSVSDRYEKETILSYVYQNNCKVVFELHDQYGDGWNGASIRVSFNDGTPLQNLTISDGNFESYIFEINSGTIVTLHWTSGSWDEECSFSVYYENGDMIYDGSSSPSSGDFYTWTNNCSGGGETSSCHHVNNLSAESSSYNALLSWDASSTAIYYKIYRDQEMIAQNITTNVYADENLTIGDYCYTITAICSDNVETNPSNEACVTISDSCYTPQNLSAIVDGLNIDLQWDDAENAQSYTVYRNDVVIVSNVMLSQYTDENLPIGDYCYQVVAVCEFGESDFSIESCNTIASINELEGQFNIFPNPADLKLIIEGENIKTIAIVNVLGQTMENIRCINKSKHEINTAAYKNGVYIVSITTTNGSVITKRFIVTH